MENMPQVRYMVSEFERVAQEEEFAIVFNFTWWAKAY